VFLFVKRGLKRGLCWSLKSVETATVKVIEKPDLETSLEEGRVTNHGLKRSIQINFKKLKIKRKIKITLLKLSFTR